VVPGAGMRRRACAQQSRSQRHRPPGRAPARRRSCDSGGILGPGGLRRAARVRNLPHHRASALQLFPESGK
jgi:hypothetical protein